MSPSINLRHFPEQHLIIFSYKKIVWVAVIYIVPLVESFLGVPPMRTITRVEKVDRQLDGHSFPLPKRCDVAQVGVRRFLDE
jgi:hypothetical protein